MLLHIKYLPSTTSTDLLDGPQYITHLIFSFCAGIWVMFGLEMINA